MPRVRVLLADNIKRVVTVDTEATQGARLGRDVYLPTGQVATPTTFLQWLGATPASGGGGSGGSSGPSLSSILTTKGDLATRDSQPQRLGIGAQDTALRVSAGGLPEWRAGAALTKADDTNVTLALGGTPATSLLAAASLTLGWTGQLAAPRGGTGFGSYTAGDLLYANSPSTLAKLGIGAAGDLITASGGAPAWIARSALFANPSAAYGVDLTGANGSSNTALRSDAVLKLDQGIAPNWTAQHRFHLVPLSIGAAGMNGDWRCYNAASVTKAASFGVNTTGLGATADQATVAFWNGTSWRSLWSGDETEVVYGNSTDNPPHIFHGQLVPNNQSVSTGGNTPVLGANKPGSAGSLAPATWWGIVVNGTQYYIPLWI